MKKKIFTFLLTTVVIVSMLPGLTFADDTTIDTTAFTQGNGSESSPYGVSTPAQLNEVRNYLDAHFILLNDIDLDAATSSGGDYCNDGSGWMPIGNNSTPFTGVFDGDGYKISNINITSSEQVLVGLFGYVENGTIKNVNMEGGNIDVVSADNVNVGSAVGYLTNGIVDNCSSSTNVSTQANLSNTAAGGIVGRSDQNSTIRNSTNDGSVIGVNSIGGIIGSASNIVISNCTNSGSITAGPLYYGMRTGGIVGHTSENTSVSNCSNSGDITVANTGESSFFGGIVGSSSSSCKLDISQCFNTGDILIEAPTDRVYAGGIVGFYSTGNITECYNTGNIEINNQENFAYIGGIVGFCTYSDINENDVTIIDCFNMGNMDSPDSTYYPFVGGILGNGYSKDCAYTNCYNVGEINSASSLYVGGIAGRISGDNDGVFSNCYYADTCYNGIGDGVGTVTIENLSDLKKQATFIGFDFTDTWAIVESERYPVLQDVPFVYATGVSIDDDLVLSVGSSQVLVPAVTPSNASNKNVSWESSDQNAVWVNSDGRVTLKKEGGATITVTTADGGYTDTCEVIVSDELDISEYGNDSVINIPDNSIVKINNSTNDTYTNVQIVCGSNVTLTLNGVKIDNTDYSYSRALSFSGSESKLILIGNSILTSYHSAGILVDDTTGLEISGTGSVEANGGSRCAGIGGEYQHGCGNITIISGNVTANGGGDAAGIGSGKEGTGGSVTISGGTVVVSGGSGAAGIGSGYEGIGGSVTISGGTVVASGGGAGGAAIGEGAHGSGFVEIVITDGTVTANGGAAGIGSGSLGRSSLDIDIQNGTIIASGGSGAGIGSGYDGTVNEIKISGGTISATGGTQSAGIGSGQKGTVRTVNIEGGRVTARGGSGGYHYYERGGAGIGTGEAGSMATTITISGGVVYASGGIVYDTETGWVTSRAIGVNNYSYSPQDMLTIEGDAAVFIERGAVATQQTPYTHTPYQIDNISEESIFGIVMNDDWEPIKAWILPITLSYDANEGESAPESVIQHINTKVTVGNDGTMLRSGYEFVNWNTKHDGQGESYEPGNTITLSNDVTLFATWKQILAINSTVYVIDPTNNILKHVSVNTSVTQLKANLLNDGTDIKVYDKEGVEYTGDAIASGMVVKLIIDDTVKDELTVSVRGDVSGNGQIDIADYILIRSSLYGLINLNTLQFASADVNKNGDIDIADYILVRSHMYGLTQI